MFYVSHSYIGASTLYACINDNSDGDKLEVKAWG